MVQRLNHNVTGQTMRHRPGTRQASVAWTIEDLRYTIGTAARTLDSGTALVDTATEATTAAAGPGQANPRLLTVASTAGFTVSTERVPQWYEIVSAAGEREHFELAGLTTNTSLLTKQPLIGTYASGATVQGVMHVTAAILASVLQNEALVEQDPPMRVLWVYADGTRHQEQLRIVREDASDILSAAVLADVRDLFPDIDTRISYQGRDTLPAFVRSTIRQLRASMLDRREKLEEWLTGEQGHWAVVWKTLMHQAKMGNFPASTDNGVAWMKYCSEEFSARWSALTIGEGGTEVVKVEPVTGTAPSADDVTYRRVIQEL